MQTCFSSDGSTCLPILCTMVVHQEDVLESGTFWGFIRSATMSRVDAGLSGMTVSLSLDLRGLSGVKVQQGVVTWSCASDFGISFTEGLRS